MFSITGDFMMPRIEPQASHDVYRRRFDGALEMSTDTDYWYVLWSHISLLLYGPDHDIPESVWNPLSALARYITKGPP